MKINDIIAEDASQRATRAYLIVRGGANGMSVPAGKFRIKQIKKHKNGGYEVMIRLHGDEMFVDVGKNYNSDALGFRTGQGQPISVDTAYRILNYAG